MAFTWPVMLWALFAVPLLVWGYLGVVRRQQAARAQLADMHLFNQLVAAPAPWRRHLPVGIYFLAVLLLVLAIARPSAAIPLPVNKATLIIAIDSSKSMIAEDVKPNRLEAAKTLAQDVVRAMPGSTRIGLITFSDYGTVLVPPSTDRHEFEEGLKQLKLRQATSVGSAIVEALRVLPGREAYLGDRLSQLRGPVPQGAPGGPQLPAPAPSPPALSELPPAAILILSDGVSNLGADPRAAAMLANEAKVKIYGVGLGQQGGTVMRVDNQLVLVPFDDTLLREITRISGGEYFSSANAQELRRVYRQLGRVIGWERRKTEITSLLAGTAGILMLTGAMLSMVWFRRVP